MAQLDDHQPKPLTNGSDPNLPHLEVDQSSPASTEASPEQLPQIAVKPPKYEGDTAELIVARMLEHHFAGGKHLMLSSDNRFWHYDGRVWCPASDQWVSGKALATIRANPLKGQRTAPVLGQVLTLLKAELSRSMLK